MQQQPVVEFSSVQPPEQTSTTVQVRWWWEVCHNCASQVLYVDRTEMPLLGRACVISTLTDRRTGRVHIHIISPDLVSHAAQTRSQDSPGDEIFISHHRAFGLAWCISQYGNAVLSAKTLTEHQRKNVSRIPDYFGLFVYVLKFQLLQ